MDENGQPKQDREEIDSLEGTSTVVEGNSGDDTEVLQSDGIVQPEPTGSPTPLGSSPKPTKGKLKEALKHLNVYLLLFILLIIIAIMVIAVSIFKSRKSTSTPSVSTQTLTQQQLEQLANSDVSVGNSKQILNVQANAVFAGQVLVRQNLEVAGTIKVGGSLNLPGITVSGTSSFSQIQTGSLTVSGSTAIQGQLTASAGLNVAGTANFSGTISASQITVSNLTLNGDLIIAHHIIGGGPTPGQSNGGALGNGGTASVGGSDTAGTVSINTGGSPVAGCFITINFTQKYKATPHVVITPIGSAAGGLAYYVNRSTSSFSICTNTSAPAGQSFGFDYIIFG